MRYLIILCVFVIFSCKPDKTPEVEVTSSDISGEWAIYHATRNGKVTKSLENGSFVFLPDNTLKSNLLETENSYTFTMNKSKILIEGSETLSQLNVKSFKQDTIVLASKMKVFEMEFFLARK